MEDNNNCDKCQELQLENLRLRKKILKLENTNIYPDYLDLEINNLSKRIFLIKDYFNLKIEKI